MGWFRKTKNAQYYDKELGQLSAKISGIEQNQIKWTLKLRRFKAIMTLYSVIIFSAFSIYVFFGQTGKRSLRDVSCLIGGPIVIALGRHVIQIITNWILSARQEQRKALDLARSDLVDQVKQNLSFNDAKAILDRYDVGWNYKDKKEEAKKAREKKQIPNETENRNQHEFARSQAGGPRTTFSSQKTQPATAAAAASNQGSQRASGGSAPYATTQVPPQQPPYSNVGSSGPSQIPSGPPFPRTPNFPRIIYEPRWYDRILDILVGEDEQSPNSRFALICHKCYSHNGLCQYGENPKYVVYICPHCGFKNGQRAQEKAVTSDEEEVAEKQDVVATQLVDEIPDTDKSDSESLKSSRTPDVKSESSFEENGSESRPGSTEPQVVGRKLSSHSPDTAPRASDFSDGEEKRDSSPEITEKI